MSKKIIPVGTTKISYYIYYYEGGRARIYPDQPDSGYRSEHLAKARMFLLTKLVSNTFELRIVFTMD
jgi:hypothetical protein